MAETERDQGMVIDVAVTHLPPTESDPWAMAQAQYILAAAQAAGALQPIVVRRLRLVPDVPDEFVQRAGVWRRGYGDGVRGVSPWQGEPPGLDEHGRGAYRQGSLVGFRSVQSGLDGFVIVEGEERLRAARLARRITVPVVIEYAQQGREKAEYAAQQEAKG